MRPAGRGYDAGRLISANRSPGKRLLTARWGLILASTVACSVVLAGCVSPTITSLQARIEEQDKEIADKQQRLVAARSAIDELRSRMLKSRDFDVERLKKAYLPVELRIASLSGGADYDGKPGDDGVTVYLQPIDRDGDVVKAAGEIRVQLYDLSAEAGRQLLGEYAVSVDEASRLWHGKLMTQHFTIKCPWRNSPPKTRDVTIRATFVDYLTSAVITTQGTCRVELPP